MCDSVREVIPMLTRLCFPSFVRTCIWDKCTLYLKQLNNFRNGTYKYEIITIMKALTLQSLLYNGLKLRRKRNTSV